MFDEPGAGARMLNTAFFPDGNILGSVVDPGVLYLWRAPSWEEIAATETKEKGTLGLLGTPEYKIEVSGEALQEIMGSYPEDGTEEKINA